MSAANDDLISRLHDLASEQGQECADRQAYEWVRTGHMNRRTFCQWLTQVTAHAQAQAYEQGRVNGYEHGRALALASEDPV